MIYFTITHHRQTFIMDNYYTILSLKMTYINIILVNNVQAYYDGATGMVACHGV